jgi:hypothetical protein
MKSKDNFDSIIRPSLRHILTQMEQHAKQYLETHGAECLSTALMVERIRNGGWSESEEAHIRDCPRCHRRAARARKSMSFPGCVVVATIMAGLVYLQWRLSSARMATAVLATLFIGIPLGVTAVKATGTKQAYVSFVDDSIASSARSSVTCTLIQNNEKTFVILTGASFKGNGRPPQHGEGLRQATSCVDKFDAHLNGQANTKGRAYETTNDPRVQLLLTKLGKLAPLDDNDAPPWYRRMGKTIIPCGPYLLSLLSMALWRCDSLRRWPGRMLARLKTASMFY